MKLNSRGAINTLLIPLILAVILLIGAIGFGGWAFAGREDYKTNADQKIASAVEVAKKQTETAKDAEFVEKEKEPYKEYRGPAPFGSLSIKYPKTWGAYMEEKTSGSNVVDGYMHPNFVPAKDSGTAFALRVQIVNNDYAKELRTFDAAVKANKVRVNPYRLPEVNSILGSRLDGEVVAKKQGVMILLPVRDKTFRVWAEAPQFTGDLDNIILKNITFDP